MSTQSKEGRKSFFSLDIDFSISQLESISILHVVSIINTDTYVEISFTKKHIVMDYNTLDKKNEYYSNVTSMKYPNIETKYTQKTILHHSNIKKSL